MGLLMLWYETLKRMRRFTLLVHNALKSAEEGRRIASPQLLHQPLHSILSLQYSLQ